MTTALFRWATHDRRVPRAWMLPITACATAAGVVGCGGDDASEPATFGRDTFPFTFEYPEGFELVDDVSASQVVGGGADESVAIAIDDDNALIIQRYTLNTEVDQGNLGRAKQEFDGLIQQIDADAAPAEEGELAGFPSLTYDAVTLTTPEDGESRLIVLFEGDQEYMINCQSTQDGRDEIEEACDLAVDTLVRRS